MMRALSRWWRRFVADEDPYTRRERIRRERLQNFWLHIQIYEQMREAVAESKKAAPK